MTEQTTEQGQAWPTNREINEAIAPAAQKFTHDEYVPFMRVMTRMSDAHNALEAEATLLRAKAAGLARDLRRSYERNHHHVHLHYADGEYVQFKDCSMWVCKNRREKMAEWGIPLEGMIEGPML